MRPELKSEKAFAGAGRLAKRPRDVQQGNDGFSQGVLTDAQSKKPLESSGFARLRWLEFEALKPLLATVAIPAPQVLPVETPLHPAVPPAFAAAESALATGEDCKAA